jgi:hypothetical protein
LPSGCTLAYTMMPPVVAGRERRRTPFKGEVRRIYIPRTSVNKGKEKGRG